MPGKLSNLFTKATLNAAMADAPAIMQASGWTSDSNNGVQQGDFNSEGATRLRESLAEIAAMPMTDLGFGILGEAFKASKLYKVWKNRKALQRLYAKNKVTSSNPQKYKDLEVIKSEFNKGKQEAVDYLKSDIKTKIDAHNEELFHRLNGNKTPYVIERNPGKTASTPMIKPETLYDTTGKWIENGNNSFLQYPGHDGYGKVMYYPNNPPKYDQMYISKLGDIEDTAFHEHFHHGRVNFTTDANTQKFLKWKADKVVKPNTESILRNPREVAPNLLEAGRRWNIPEIDYPGPTEAKKIIQKIITEDPLKSKVVSETVWETKPKRVWDALQGKYMSTLPISIVGSTFIDEKE